MYKVLMIDDEKPVRQAITALGHWTELGIGPIFEAMEGEHGLALLREHQPEIVLLDMKMPNMDGARFLEIATREFPHIKYITISGYDDFKYTKQAIKAKALDYLLKPVIESELNDVLKRAISELDAEKQRRTAALHQEILQNISLPLAKEKLMISLIHNDFNEQFTGEYRTILNCRETDRNYGVAIYCVINLDEVCLGSFDGVRQAAVAAIIEIINSFNEEWDSGISFQDYQAKNEIIQMLSRNVNTETGGREQVAAKIGRIITNLEERYGFYIVAGLGKFYPEIESVHHSFKEATNILHNINLLEFKERVFTEYESDYQRGRKSFFDKKELLMYALESGDPDFTREIVREYFNQIRNSGYLSLEYLQRTVREFIVLLETIMAQIEIPGGPGIVAEFSNEASLTSFTRLEDFRDVVYQVVEKILHTMGNNLGTSVKKDLYEIKDYIQKNFRQEIKLNLFSDRYYLSKEYLSKLFKDEFGYTIYEYVLKVRMEKARELLSDPEVKVLTVAERLGYKDQNYFSRAFKVYYGLSPTEYRDMNN